MSSFPTEKDYETFEEFALAASVWMNENPEAHLNRCSVDGEVILFFDDMPPAKQPGHVYSDFGVENYYRTGICEYHYDELADQVDESISDESASSDPQSASKSPNNAQSGDSVSEPIESSFDSQSFMESIWNNADPFKDDDPTRPEPM